MITITTQIFIFIPAMVILFWIMPDKKIKVIFGEIRKTLQILPISKIAQAIISWSKKKSDP
ncbi:hypothetical protein [Flavobacterium frigoris]|uniref:Uncharacterized protein n=1 Tax=Flavobacterium frigoris TaxID=229204 RepID=A0A1H9H8C1_FLAFI|nr:hypothetical protein [Flavobacterium frigoris]SEQ58609.1 hypothetical protein SAMN05444355_10358 [Flavobacterium frigoris]